MKRKFGTTISAMMLAVHLGSPLAAAEPTLEQLGVIADYLEANDVEALRAYVLLHPELLDENSQLAALLRQFTEDSVNVTEYLGFEPDLRDAVRGAATLRSSGSCAPPDVCPPEVAPPPAATPPVATPAVAPPLLGAPPVVDAVPPAATPPDAVGPDDTPPEADVSDDETDDPAAEDPGTPAQEAGDPAPGAGPSDPAAPAVPEVPAVSEEPAPAGDAIY